MTRDPHYRRLSYHAGRGGIAKEGNLTLHLDEPPQVFPRAIDIEFGEIAQGEMAWPPYVREHGDDRKRDMTPPELLLLRSWLDSLLSAVIGAARNVQVFHERRK